MKSDLSALEQEMLNKARETAFPCPVTGFLLDSYLANGVCWGYVYDHVKMDPQTGRFSDGHEIHTSTIGAFFEFGEYIILVTRNSVYVCIGQRDQQMALMEDLRPLPGPALH
ncbi:MAG: hypothetical protein ACRBBM_05155 [Pseudomonadaceae bacterium]